MINSLGFQFVTLLRIVDSLGQIKVFDLHIETEIIADVLTSQGESNLLISLDDAHCVIGAPSRCFGDAL
jgi:hypothetical protein